MNKQCKHYTTITATLRFRKITGIQWSMVGSKPGTKTYISKALLVEFNFTDLTCILLSLYILLADYSFEIKSGFL